jgi:hypothetical protein
MADLAMMYSSQYKYNEALCLHLEVLEFHRRALPQNHPNIGEATAALPFASLQRDAMLMSSCAGVVMGRLASAFQDLGMHEEAIKTLQEAVERMEANLASNP